MTGPALSARVDRTFVEVAMSSAVVDLGVDPFDPPGTGTSPDALEVRPEDEVAVQRVEQWFRDYAQNRDPVLRERIILALSLIHISEPTRLLSISYAVFCLKKKKDIR